MSTKNTIFAMRVLSVFLIIALSIGPMGITPAHAAGILHVTPDGSGDCSNWANACSLQTALTDAVSGDEIWVQAGVYKPTIGTDRAATFQLKSGVAVYGGFAGTESARDERDLTLNVTTLSGDLLGNDNNIILPDEPTRADNSYNVLIGASGAILDGFTVTAGNANGDAFPGAGGGGLFELYGGSILINILFLRNTSTGGGGIISLNSDTVLTDITFRENNAVAGGGMYTYSPTNNPTLTRVIFDNNSSATNGGGMFIGQGNFTLTDAVFTNNSANMGGGLYNEASGLVMNNIAFSDNSAVTYGGGMMQSTYGKVSLANATFAENSAQNGGGFANFSSYKHDPSTLTNITFTGNTAKTDGGGIYNSSWSIIRNTILWGNTDLSGLQVYDNVNATMSDSVVEGECSIYTICTNITTDDPLLGTLGDYGGFTQTIPIQAGSSAIGATNNNCPATDQRGLPRSNPTCDIGAFELVTDIDAPTIISITRVNPNPTNLASVKFTVTFSEPVTGVDFGDFSLMATDGINGALVTDVNGAGTVYVVTVNTGTHNVSNADLININTATLEQLDSLPGIGPTTAQKIIGYRTVHGPFQRSEDIMNVSGIGPSTFEKIKNLITVGLFLRLDVIDDDTIMDASNNKLGGLGLGNGDFTRGEYYTLTDSSVFTDVPSTYWASSFIERLYNAGITGGCSASPLMYCPEATVTRAQMAVFLLRGIHGSAYTPPAATGTVFADVPSTHWAAAWIEQLYVEGITGGCSGGNYCPETPVTRDQMAVFLLRAKHSSAHVPPAPTGVFSDVPTNYWSAAWIEELAAEGITSGCGPSLYCPTTVVTRAQMAVFLVKTFSLP